MRPEGVMRSFQLSKYRDILVNSSFRNFWLGFLISNLGDTMSKVALAWYVWEETQSPEALGLLTFLNLGPVVLGGFLAGWLLDRFDKRMVMLVDSVFRGAVMALVPMLFFMGRLEIWQVYAVAAVYGFLGMITWAGGPSIVPALVEEKHLPTANALESFAFTAGNVLGPTLAGLLIATIGAPNVVALDALSFFLFALALVYVRMPERADVEASPDVPASEAGYRPAFRLLFGNHILASITYMYFATNIANGMLLVWLPIYADINLNGGPQLYGFLLAAMSAGEVLAAFVAGGLTYRISLGRLISSALIVGGLLLAAVQVFANPYWAAFWLFMFGVAIGPLTLWAQTLRMRIIPAELRGRSFALLRTMMVAGYPVGGALAGWLTAALGIPGLILLSAGMKTLAGLGGMSAKQLRDSNDYV